MTQPDCRGFILEVSLECDHCQRDTPAAEGRRAIIDGPFGRYTLQLCPECYRDGIDDGILEPYPGDEPPTS
jgi:hypothetical protein